MLQNDVVRGMWIEVRTPAPSHFTPTLEFEDLLKVRDALSGRSVPGLVVVIAREREEFLSPD